MIGGPNQSHKVNFKEPPLVGERCSREHSHFGPSILFPNFSEKSFGKERDFLRLLRLSPGILRARFIEGIAEHGNWIFLIKTFLEIKSNDLINASLIGICLV